MDCQQAAEFPVLPEGRADEGKESGEAVVPPVPGDFPTAKPVSFEQLSSGREDSQFLEVRGVVRAVRLEEQRLIFVIEVAVVVFNTSEKSEPFLLWRESRAVKTESPAHSIISLVISATTPSPATAGSAAISPSQSL